MRMTMFTVAVLLASIATGGNLVFAQAPIVKAGDAYSSRAKASLNRDYAAVIPTAYSCGDEPVSSCCDKACDKAAVSCDGGCDSAGCEAEGPWKLFKDPVLGFNVGGWTQLGYHTYSNPGIFNNHSDGVRLHQQWMFAEKIADGSKGIGFGGRIDYVYGVDAQDTQAFGVNPQNNHWDSNWDNGIYGHALPQAYGEVAMGDLSVKVGKFFTIIGHEVVQATGNFFYSHSYTMYNSEPFTHTGVLSTYKVADGISMYNGWVQGWDSGFEDNGDAYLGGGSVKLTDNIDYISGVVLGRFGKNANAEKGMMVSNIIKAKLTDKLNYVFWFDVLDTDRTGLIRERKTFDLNQYLLYAINDKVTWGNRIEWYNVDKGVFNATATNDIYAYTTGLNYRVNGNLLFRPELRFDWDKGNLVGIERGPNTATVGSDMIFTF
jgi:Putative beta-barrel porin-2, OmpL-like. bbp2